MSAIKTVAGFAIVAVALGAGARAQRDFEVEADNTVAPMIEKSVRMTAADFNPQVALVPRELKGFSIVKVQIARSRIGAMIDSTLGGGDRSYDVYVRFREDGGEKCLTLELKWRSKEEAWKVSHPGAMDRCEPVW